MANRFLRRADAGLIAEKLCTKAVMERGLIAEGDRILIGASGGKDSTVLAWLLSRLRSVLRVNFELTAVHITGDFENGEDSGTGGSIKSILAERMGGWNIPFVNLDVPVTGRLKPGRQMNCYWCSTQRRTELLHYAIENHFSKIALGHHLDDIIETFFMNMMNKGELKAMPILLSYTKYPVSLIRPLAYLEEKQIIACAEKLDVLGSVCTCPYGVNSGRAEIRKKIAELCGGRGEVKRRILAALSSGQNDLLIESGTGPGSY
ncbi:MAG: tRNA 2-thiocytidine biosynthesis TtcA family protein [Treponema sp.]|nr:tRNA 2-thiocytidine biosynthesis TtcA family protein [Treponema sp.]